jgi:hypothetical protein
MEPPNYQVQTAHYGRTCMQCRFRNGDDCTKYNFAVKSGCYCDDWAWDGVVRFV